MSLEAAETEGLVEVDEVGVALDAPEGEVQLWRNCLVNYFFLFSVNYLFLSAMLTYIISSHKNFASKKNEI